MQQCFVCLSTNLSVDNGVLLCDDCGTQNQSTPEATAQDVEEQLRQQAVAYLQCLTTLLLPHTGFLDYQLGN
ncbi:hypothetical protein HaLaN_08055, partial [Haematococcus lacustris]